MTCIIGLEHGGQVYMGCDSAITDGWALRATSLKKIIRLEIVRGDPLGSLPMLIGLSGYPRALQVIAHNLALPAFFNQTPDDPLSYIVGDFVPALRECLKTHGVAKVADNRETLYSYFLVGFCGQVYELDFNYQVTQHVDPFEAIGSGYTFALGAMEALADLPPKKRVKRALEITAKFCGDVRGPFYVEVV